MYPWAVMYWFLAFRCSDSVVFFVFHDFIRRYKILPQLPVSYDISPLKRGKLKILTTSSQASDWTFKFDSWEWRNIVTTLET